MVRRKKCKTARSTNLQCACTCIFLKATQQVVHGSPYKMHSMVVVVGGDEMQQELVVLEVTELVKYQKLRVT